MNRRMTALATLGLSFAISFAAGAQQPPAGAAAPGRAGQPAPPPPQNLQILPKDISRPELQATMRAFAEGLGVQCNYCHVAEGRGGRNDFAADEKQTKKTARVMMQIVARANESIAQGVAKPAAELTKVQCVTCHRGKAIPENPPPAAPPAAAAPATPPGH